MADKSIVSVEDSAASDCFAYVGQYANQGVDYISYSPWMALNSLSCISQISTAIILNFIPSKVRVRKQALNYSWFNGQASSGICLVY